MMGKNILQSIGALAAALVTHYLIYAYRFMWYLDHASYVKLLSAYAVFVAAMALLLFVAPRWWLMGSLALLVLLSPAFIGVHYLVPVGPAFVGVAFISAAMFAGVAIFRSRGSRMDDVV